MTEFIIRLHEMVFDPERLPVALAALFLSACAGVLFGPLGGNANPLFWRVIDGLFGGIGGRLDKTQRGAGELVLRGLVITVTALGISWLTGRFAEEIAGYYPLWRVPEILALSLTLTAGAAWFALFRLHAALKKGKAGEGGYYVLARSARRNLAGSDDYTITRAGIGFAVRSFDKGLVAPLIWYLIAGLPGAYIYTTLAALSWRFGKDGFTKGFGASMLALEKLMGFVPGLFAGFLLALAGVSTPTARAGRALSGWAASKGRAAYAEGGYPLTSAAWGLNISLGGPGQDLDGSALAAGWTGPEGATARLEARHLYRAVYLSVVAHLLLAVALGGAMLFAGGRLWNWFPVLGG